MILYRPTKMPYEAMTLLFGMEMRWNYIFQFPLAMDLNTRQIKLNFCMNDIIPAVDMNPIQW